MQKRGCGDHAMRSLASFVCVRQVHEEVVLNAARGIVISKERRGGWWSDVLRLLQGDREFRNPGLIPFPGHLEHKVRSPASLKEGVRSSRLLGEGGALRGPSQRDTDLHDGAQLRYLRMLKELRANSQVCTDSHKAWPKAEPSHVPLHEGARKGERALELPRSMNIVQRAGRSRRKGS